METDFGRNVTDRVDVFVNGSPTAASTADLVAAAAKDGPLLNEE